MEEFESAIRSVCEPIFNRPLSDISFGHFLLNLFQTARRFDMRVQPQLVLLQKTLLYIEGLGRQLYPELDLWSTAKPFLERWMHQQVGPRAFARKMRKNLPKISEQAPDIPLMAHKLLRDATEGTLELNWKSEALDKLLEEVQQANQRTIGAIGAGSMIIASALLLVLGQDAPVSPMFGWLLGGGGGVLLFSVWLKTKT